MKTFTKTNIVGVITSRDKTIKVDVCRFVKDGTQRVFFAPEVKGKRINNTMYARKYDAESLGRRYIKFKDKP